MGTGFAARWLPDGEGVVIAGGDHFRVRAATGRVDTILLPEGLTADFQGFDVDPAGDRLAFASLEQARGTLSLLSLRSGQVESILRDTVPLFSPTWSTDGESISVLRAEAPRSALLVIEADNSETRTLRGGMEPFEKTPHLSRSRDGTFAYVRSDGYSNLWVASRPSAADTLVTIRQLTFGTLNKGFFNSSLGQAKQFSVSPDGRRAAFVARTVSGNDLFSISIDGGEETRVTFTGDVHSGPVWAPDGRTMAYVTVRNGLLHVASVDLRSSLVKVDVATRPSPWGLMAWAPGDLLAYTEDRAGSFDVRLGDPRVPDGWRTLANTSPLIPWLAYSESGGLLTLAAGRRVVVFDTAGSVQDSVHVPLLDPRVVRLSNQGTLAVSGEGAAILGQTSPGGRFTTEVRLPWRSAICEEVPRSGGLTFLCSVQEGGRDAWLIRNSQNGNRP
ncbi:MAG: hypothetical protein HKO53_12095 [Gemmatimonadetes bacterium]|nr:hypothetical protein [Gemmatimonadota bacterium]